MPEMLLCVQRDREIGHLYADALRAVGHEVLCANDGRSTFETLGRQTPSMIILDVHLPRQDGFEILAEMRMRAEARQVPVLLLSEGDVTPEMSARAQKLGALGVESSPMDVERLLSKVASQLTKKKTKPAAAARVPSKGSLKVVPFPELLRGLQVDAVDGVLLLDHGKKKKAIELRGGWPVSVKSNLVSECFGSYLVAQGRCTQQQLDESVARMRTGEGLQGEVLVAMQVLDDEALGDALNAHALDKFFEIFSWRDGGFQFRTGAHVQRGSSFGLRGHPSNLILEGIRRHFPLKQIDRYLTLHRDVRLVSSGRAMDQIDSIGLQAETLGWLEAWDGSQTLGSLLDESEEIRRMAFGLVTIELLAVVGPEGASEDVAPRAGIPSPEVRGLPVDSKTDEELRIELASLANEMQNKNHYETLGVDSTASDEEIQAAYQQLARRAHPDRFHGASGSVRQLAAQVYERIEQAHAAIATEDDRARYAQELSRGRRNAAVQDEGKRALQAETEFQRAEKKIAVRDYEGALLCFGRAMENFPSEGEYRAHYGWCLYLCHPDNEVMIAEALEHCREGLKLAKDREKPYLLLGRLYKATGRVNAAKKMFLRAVEIRPQCVEAMRELRIMNMRRDRDKGVLKRIFRR